MNKVIAVILTGEAGSYKAALAAAAGATKDFERASESGATSAAKFGLAAKAAAAIAALALAAIAVAALKMTVDFDAAMRNVNSIAQMPEAAFVNLRQQVLDLSKTLPQTATTLAKGLYDIASAGITGADGMTVLKASAMAASAGLSDTQTAATAIIGVLKAYGLAASDSAHISDILFQTVNVGILTFSDLAHGLGEVVGTGAAAKVSISELGAAVAAMTLAGVPAAEAFTSLSRLMISFAKPTTEMSNLFHNLGYESAFAALQALGLHGTMELIRHSVEPTLPVMKSLFGDIRSARGAMALFTADGANYAQTFAAIANETTVAGSTQRAFNEQMKSLSSQWELFVNRMSAGAIQVGLIAIPALVKGLGGVQSGVESMVSAAQAAAGLLGPFFSGIASAAVSLGNTAMHLASDLEPAAKMFAIIAGSTVVVTLNLLASALAATAGFLEDHRLLVEAIVILFAGKWVAAMASAALATGQMVAELLVMNKLGLASLVEDIARRVVLLTQALVGIGGAGTYITSLKAAFSGLGATIAAIAPTLVGAFVVGEVIAFTNSLKNAEAQADALIKTLTKDVKVNNWKSYEDAIRSVNAETDKLEGKTRQDFWGSWKQGVASVWQQMTPLKNTILDTAEAEGRLREEVMRLNQEWVRGHGNATGLMELLGISIDAVGRFADKAGINLGALANKDLPWAAAQMKPLIDATEGGTVATDALGASFQIAADATSSATERVKAYKDALDALIGIHLSVFNANTKLADAMDTLREKTGKFGVNLDETSKSGREVRDALSGSADAALALAKAIADEQGIPAGVKSLQDYRDGLVATLKKAGETDAQIQVLLTSLGLTDANFTAELSVNGADTAQAQADALNKSLAAAAAPKKIQIEAAPAETGLLGLQQHMAQYALSDPTARVFATIDPALASLDALSHKEFVYEGSNPTAVVYADITPAAGGIDALDAKALQYANSNPTAQVHADTAPATNVLTDWINSNDGRGITINAEVKFRQDVLNRFINGIPGVQQRWGGVVEHAQSGLLNADIYNRPMYAFAEPATGGEAFIPKYGDRARSLAIAATAAGWYGATVVDDQKKRAMSGFGSMTGTTTAGGTVRHETRVIEVHSAPVVQVAGDLSAMQEARMERTTRKATEKGVRDALNDRLAGLVG